ncbi:MAG: cytochrome P450 [Acidimicrobiales bacterium]
MPVITAKSPHDIFTTEFFQDPYPTYRSMREQDPVLELPFDLNLEQAQVINATGATTWILTGHSAVSDALRDTDVFSSALPSPTGEPQTELEQGRLVLINSDPPRHTALRQLINRAFNQRQVAELEPMVRDMATRLVAAIEGGVSVDVMPQLCESLPIAVIAALLGVPVELHQQFKMWSDAMIAAADPASLDQNLAKIIELQEFFAGEVADRRARPRDDMISHLANARIEGRPLEDWEAVSFCVLILLAGNETTRNLLGCGLNVLADRRELWSLLRRDRSLIEPFVEESLRFDSPVQVLNRWTKRAVDFHGHAIPAHANIAVAYAAANRDPDVFPDPDAFVLDRPPGRHVAFAIGAHFCVGAWLARAEARLTFNALLDRFSAVERGGATVMQHHSRVVRGPAVLPLIFS